MKPTPDLLSILKTLRLFTFCCRFSPATIAASSKIFCYSQQVKKLEDSMIAQLMAQSDVWRNISGVSDVEVAKMIRDDNVDILVDLAGHTANNRLKVFTLKPAPLQVT